MWKMILLLVIGGLLLLFLWRRVESPAKFVAVGGSVLDEQPVVISSVVHEFPMTSPVLPVDFPAPPSFGLPGNIAPIYFPGITYGAPIIKPPMVVFPLGKPIPDSVLAPFEYKYLEKVETPVMQVPITIPDYH